MEKITFKEVWEQIASYGAPLWCGVIGAIIVFIIEIILCNKKIIFSNSNKKIDKAREQGHIVTGKLVKSTYVDRNNDTKATDRRYKGKYKYKVDGIEYTYYLNSVGIPLGYTIDLYYLNNPRKAFSKYDIKPSPFQILLYIIPIAVSIIIMKLMGYN